MRKRLRSCSDKIVISALLILIISFFMTSCKQTNKSKAIRILFLHHSTGQNLWDGDRSTFFSKAFGKFSSRISGKLKRKAEIPSLFRKYNKEFHTNYSIDEMIFPKSSPYGWHNYPYDYYNIWVKNAGNETYKDEPTLEILSKKYQVIMLKHCFPVCNIQDESNLADINSDRKTIANYKLQYLALREKFHALPDTKFIIFTGAAQVKSNITEPEAQRARDFFSWVVNEWDIQNDNIYIWDLYSLQTEGGIYFNEKYSYSPNDSHLNIAFSKRAAKLLSARVIDVIENNGLKTNNRGEKIE